ncbi:MAG: metal-dependent hydrolase [Balneolales bacterium]
MNTQVQAFWLGHSAFKLVSPKGSIIYVDPFLTGNPQTPDSEKAPEAIDYILLTHGHDDHVGDTLDLAGKTGARVLSIVELSALLVRDGLPEDQAIEMNKGGTVQFDDFKVTMTSANHSSSYNGQYAGDPAGLIIHFEDDIKVYHAGDTNIMMDFKLYWELYRPEVALLPVGDHYVMSPEEASYSCKLLRPKLAIPIHYGTFPVLTGSPEEFKQVTEERSKGKTRVVIPEAGTNFLEEEEGPSES